MKKRLAEKEDGLHELWDGKALSHTQSPGWMYEIESTRPPGCMDEIGMDEITHGFWNGKAWMDG